MSVLLKAGLNCLKFSLGCVIFSVLCRGSIDRSGARSDNSNGKKFEKFCIVEFSELNSLSIEPIKFINPGMPDSKKSEGRFKALESLIFCLSGSVYVLYVTLYLPSPSSLVVFSVQIYY